jgi:hypothetical protein
LGRRPATPGYAELAIADWDLGRRPAGPGYAEFAIAD